MKKDIQIPEVSDVYVAIVNEFNKEHRTFDWNAYIINNKDVDLDTVLIVTKGYNESKITPVMRHSIKMLPARSYAKIEYLQEEVLKIISSIVGRKEKKDSMEQQGWQKPSFPPKHPVQKTRKAKRKNLTICC